MHALLCALDLLYLGVTIENMCRRHYRAPGHHYQRLFVILYDINLILVLVFTFIDELDIISNFLEDKYLYFFQRYMLQAKLRFVSTKPS